MVVKILWKDNNLFHKTAYLILDIKLEFHHYSLRPSEDVKIGETRV